MSATLNLGTDGQWATKENSLLSYNDENGNYKPLPFDFTRASSATVVNKAGLIETVQSGTPRIDFLGNTNGALLLEPQRTNLVVNSANGEYGNAPASEINTIAPDGSNNGLILIPDSLSDRYEYIISGGTYATNTQLTYSWYRKRITTPTGASRVGDLDPAGVNVSFIGSTTQTQSVVNGYDRFEAVFSIIDGSLESKLRMYFGNVIGVGNSSVAYWGHQLELGSFATSYIPTQGSTVTRNLETCTGAGNDQVINSTEGVLYAEISALADDGSYRLLGFSDGTSANRIYIGYSSVNNITCSVQVSSSIVYNFNLTADITINSKLALKYKENDFALWVNGVEADSQSSGNTFPVGTLTQMQFASAVLSSPFYGKTKDVRVYNTALTDTELQALTTI